MVHEDELPIRETNPLRPLSPYAVSKVGQDYLGYQYFMSFGTKVVRTRGFNHDGPRRGDVFVSSNFAKQLASIEKGKKAPVIHVGNLEARRDFTDVRDIVRGYWLALDGGCEPGEAYNVCTGKDYTIQNVLDELIRMSGVEVEVRQDPERLRPSDVPVLLGDSTKFQKATGWKPDDPLRDHASRHARLLESGDRLSACARHGGGRFRRTPPHGPPPRPGPRGLWCGSSDRWGTQ